MKITFTLTKMGLWKYYLSAWDHHYGPGFVTLTFGPPLFLVLFGYTLYAWAFVAFLLVWQIITFLKVIWLPYIKVARHASTFGERTLELGRFDCCWSRPGFSSYYYHWTRFNEIAETRTHIYLSLDKNDSMLLIPKNIFADPSESHLFCEQAKRYWDEAIMREQHHSQVATGIWPPPPRLG